MGESVLDILLRNNEFPILFMGSGIPKRYLKNYPSWEDLLKELWMKTGIQEDFYAYLNSCRNKLQNENHSDIDFNVNIKTADKLKGVVDSMYFDGKLKIRGLDQETVYRKNISPFKKMVANRFGQYEYKDGIKNELLAFRQMMLKTQVIFTTNYDSFIEDNYNKTSRNSIRRYIGQNGFFQQTPGYAEIYKIHGCSSMPISLIIASRDYEEFDKKSILISSKIISMLLHSPIIFIGCSLKDRNIRSIIKNFSSALTDKERRSSEKRIILVNRKEDERNIIEEAFIDVDLGCKMTILHTDNFSEVYKSISSINQGVAPSEIRRYQHVIKELIIARGKKGTLDTLLMYPHELDCIEKTLKNKNIVIAIGDEAVIYKMPSIIQYMYDYISEKFEQNIDVF